MTTNDGIIVWFQRVALDGAWIVWAWLSSHCIYIGIVCFVLIAYGVM
jgi:hypothetical protein